MVVLQYTAELHVLHFELEKRKKFVKFDQKFIQKTNILHWQTEDKGKGKTLNGHHQVYMGKMDH